MIDPTSELGEDVTEENAPRCATCEEPIIRNPTHRVITWVQDGTVHSLHFCDEECRLAWDADYDD
jgi:hypothetical protein